MSIPPASKAATLSLSVLKSDLVFVEVDEEDEEIFRASKELELATDSFAEREAAAFAAELATDKLWDKFNKIS
jgi:hypothetical protein